MRVLLVEDSDVIRTRLRAMIGEIERDALVTEAIGEDEAVLDIGREHPDLVILDLSLAQGNGLGVLRSVWSDFPQTRVAVLTSHADGPYRKKCLELGARWFFDKAKEFEKVRGVLREIGLGKPAEE